MGTPCDTLQLYIYIYIYTYDVRKPYKRRAVFGTFLYDMQHKVIRSPACPTYSTPNGTRVLTPGCSDLGISVAKRAAVPALHVPILRRRIKAFGVVPSQPRRHKPLDRQSFQQIGDN